MCGRTCCTIAPGAVPYACASVTPKNQGLPKWSSDKASGSYSASTNVPPTRNTPVLMRAEGLGERGKEFEPQDYVVHPMLWGFVPPWHQGDDPTKHGLTTNNARLEGLTSSKLYKPSINKNMRCVVICDGFYEWKAPEDKKSGATKQPYMIYAKQDDGVKIEEMDKCTPETCYTEEKGWTGPKPLFMAGIYSVWHGTHRGEEETPEARAEDVYSYAVITRAANKVTGWLHGRVPAILADEEAVRAWLDGDVESEEALGALKPVKEGQLAWHPVSTDVGNVRNQGESLNAPIELNEKGKAVTASSKLMSSWLKRSASEEKKAKQEEAESEVKEEPDKKKPKKEEVEKENK